MGGTMADAELVTIAHDMRYAWNVIRPRCEEIAAEMRLYVNKPWKWWAFWKLDREISRLHREWQSILDRSESHLDRR
jgi:hypothetical protein